jgi:hypothetical protein
MSKTRICPSATSVAPPMRISMTDLRYSLSQDGSGVGAADIVRRATTVPTVITPGG